MYFVLLLVVYDVWPLQGSYGVQRDVPRDDAVQSWSDILDAADVYSADDGLHAVVSAVCYYYAQQMMAYMQ